MYYYYKIEKYN